MIATLLLLAAAPAHADATPAQAIAAFYAPYRRDEANDAAWERPIFTPRLTALIARWRAVTPSDEVDALSDFDWLCQCQDWDAAKIGARVRSARAVATDRRELVVTLAGSGNPPPRLRFVLQRRNGRWLIDDLFATGFARGLHAALLSTIAEDEALRRKH